jgi:uncharacterized protein YdcH (DUF465 family)
MERNAKDEITAHLMQTNEGFRSLAEQHLEYDRKVSELDRKPDFTAADEIEEHRLKKIRLRIKDEMQQVIGQHISQHVS